MTGALGAERLLNPNASHMMGGPYLGLGSGTSKRRRGRCSIDLSARTVVMVYRRCGSSWVDPLLVVSDLREPMLEPKYCFILLLVSGKAHGQDARERILDLSSRFVSAAAARSDHR